MSVSWRVTVNFSRPLRRGIHMEKVDAIRDPVLDEHPLS